MQARFMIEDPQNIQATMKLTTSLKEWEALRDQLENKWPSSDLSYKISELLAQARKVFYVTEKDEKP